MVDHHSAFIFNLQLERRAVCITNFPTKFIEFLESTKFMPERLLVKRDEVFRTLEPWLQNLASKYENLPALEYAQRSMREFI